MKSYKVLVSNIVYDIEEEDVVDEIAARADIEEDSEEYYDAIHQRIHEIQASLPKELEIEVSSCDEDDMFSEAIDQVSSLTGWLIDTCDCKIVGEN